jgi:hypothetical protein
VLNTWSQLDTYKLYITAYEAIIQHLEKENDEDSPPPLWQNAIHGSLPPLSGKQGWLQCSLPLFTVEQHSSQCVQELQATISCNFPPVVKLPAIISEADPLVLTSGNQGEGVCARLTGRLCGASTAE